MFRVILGTTEGEVIDSFDLEADDFEGLGGNILLDDLREWVERYQRFHPEEG
jgi:hypothetical protein